MRDTIGTDQLLFCDITWGAGGSTSQLSMDIAIYIQQQLHVTCNLHMTCTNMMMIPSPPPASATSLAAAEEEEVVAAAVVIEPISPQQAIQNSIQEAIDHDVINIFALRGDPPVNADGSHASTFVPTPDGFTCALDLVQFIRHEDTKFRNITNHTTQLGVGVAGYPEGHPVAITVVDDVATMTPTEEIRSSYDYDTQTTFTCRDAQYQKELQYLQEKVNAGADYIITQMFYDTTVYVQFVHDCRSMGIECPILPGIMCINNVTGFFKMTKFCKTRIPAPLYHAMMDLLHRSQDDTDITTQTTTTNHTAAAAASAIAEDIKLFGIQYGVEQCQQIMYPTTEILARYPLYTPPPVLHFYTLNLEKVVIGILTELGYIQPPPVMNKM
jgi:methylenetetrahydrofolate reductase (NADPH)